MSRDGRPGYKKSVKVTPKLKLVTEEAGQGSAAPGARSAESSLLDAAFRAHAAAVATLALRILGRKDDVEDVVHDVFLAAQRGLGLGTTGSPSLPTRVDNSVDWK